MTPDPKPAAESTAPHGLDEGLRLALAAEDGGGGKPLVDWLAGHPHLAEEVARFAAAQRGVAGAVGPLRAAAGPGAGAAVGGFELAEEIGRGGMGVVYRAFDPGLKREVAVKLVRAAGGLSPEEAARFRFEAEAAAALDHPHVVRAFQFGEAGGVPYLVMPLMEGGSLAAWLKSLGPARRLAPRRAAEVVRDVALGVHHAHQRGLIHRDLKPANILRDRDGRPHVADFGLARAVGGPASGSGGVAGTAAYMAPEQARGEKGLTTAVDVWALGAVLYELLAGRPPFGADDLIPVLKRVTDDPTPSVTAARPDAPADLAAVCARCLEKHPDDRYPSARALADDLTRFLNGEPLGQASRRRVLGRVTRALRWQPESGGNWTASVVTAAQHAAANGGVQALVWVGHPAWACGLLAAHTGLGAVLFWWFVVRRMDALAPAERASGVIQLGTLLGVAALIPPTLILNGGNILAVYPPGAILVGFGLFAHGPWWGSMYLAGAGFMLLGAALPLLPPGVWPGVYGLAGGLILLLIGVRLRAFGRSPADDPPGDAP